MQPELFTSFAPQELAAALEPVRTHHAFQNHVTNFTQRIEDNRGAPVVFEALGASRDRAQLSHFCDQVEHYLAVGPDSARARIDLTDGRVTVSPSSRGSPLATRPNSSRYSGRVTKSPRTQACRRSSSRSAARPGSPRNRRVAKSNPVTGMSGLRVGGQSNASSEILADTARIDIAPPESFDQSAAIVPRIVGEPDHDRR